MTESTPSPILLFDIDGTLMRTQGAGLRAMTEAFAALYGWDNALGDMDFAGRSDTWIVGEAMGRRQQPVTPEAIAAFQDAYGPALQRMLLERAASGNGGGLLPGIRELLQALQASGAVMGLGTGNFRRTAQIKLEHFQIQEHFLDGGFGDDGAERPDLLAAGLARLRPHAGPDAPCVVIGDTVHDVTAGHAIGARVVAVETGFDTAERLRQSGADIVLKDCSELPLAVAAILGS